METRDYLKYIVEEIHSTVFATVDKEGRLKMNENIAFTAMKKATIPFPAWQCSFRAR